VDYVGPLTPYHSYTYLRVCMDHFAHLPEAIPLTNITTEAVAHAFLSGWISRFGVPTTLTSPSIESLIRLFIQWFLISSARSCVPTLFSFLCSVPCRLDITPVKGGHTPIKDEQGTREDEIANVEAQGRTDSTMADMAVIQYLELCKGY